VLDEGSVFMGYVSKCPLTDQYGENVWMRVRIASTYDTTGDGTTDSHSFSAALYGADEEKTEAWKKFTIEATGSWSVGVLEYLGIKTTLIIPVGSKGVHDSQPGMYKRAVPYIGNADSQNPVYNFTVNGEEFYTPRQ